MKKQMIFSFNDGCFEQGFGQVAIQLSWENINHQLQCYFNDAPQLPNYYFNWLSKYEILLNISRGTIYEDDQEDDQTGLFISQAELESRNMTECNQAFEDLQNNFNDWLDPVKQQLKLELEINSGDEIDVVIQTKNISSQLIRDILHKLPWNRWDLFNRDNFTDVALSFSNSEQNNSASEKKISKRVNILCVLGDSSNINVEADRRLLRKIPGAYCVFLRQPKKSDFFKFIEQERWDILFFSGHSQTDKDTGLLHLNPQERLDIQEIKDILKKGDNKDTCKKDYKNKNKQDIKLAIFNSCDGLGLAHQLADLDIAQIIVWREPVEDEIAQEFLKYFLYSFSKDGLSLYRSVQKARLEVQEYINKDDRFPKISWLPVIHQNLAKESITWEQLRGLPNIKINYQQETPRQTLINRVKESWIEGVLDKSLNIQETLELGLIECPREVTASSMEPGENSPPENKQLPEGTRAIDVFGELQNKKTMLILGKSGSGKTTALLEIAKELIDNAEQDINSLVPVVLNLSSWAGEEKTKPLADWLVQEINRIYLFPKQQCKSWVENQQLVLLLDGLDEIKETQKRRDCVRAINEFLGKYNTTEIVVCSQIRKYKEIEEKLHFQNAVFYQQLTQEQIDRYFDDAKDALLGVWELKKEEEAIQKLTTSPLFIHFIYVAYKNKSKEELSYLESLEERRNDLLEKYIEKKITEQRRKYPDNKSRHWLKWLANQMTDKYQKVFLIEQVQPDWLPKEQEWMYLIGSRFFLGIIVGLIGVLHFSTQVTDDLGLQISLVIPSLIAGILSSLSSLFLSNFFPRFIDSGKQVVIFAIPLLIKSGLHRLASLLLQDYRFIYLFLRKHISRFIPGVISGLIYVTISAVIVYPLVNVRLITLVSPLMIDGIALGILLTLINQEIGLIDTLKNSWKKAGRYGLIGLIGGVLYVLARWLFTDVYETHPGLHGGLKVLNEFQYAPIIVELITFTTLPILIGYWDKGVNLEQTINPNQGIWRSVNNACLFFLVFFSTGTLYGFPYSENIYEVISIGLAVGLLAGLAGGRGPVFAGIVLIQHFTLRVILWLKGDIPWNYAQFLDDAVKNNLLRRVGGGYIFIHGTLQEHFAQMPSQINT